MKISGIYKIESKIKPKRIYIGSAVNISNRWTSHINDLKTKNGRANKRMQNHVNKYGISDLQFSIIIGCSKEDLLKIEQFFIDAYNPWFNMFKIAGSPIGHKCSDETKRKISDTEKRMGYKNHLGKHHTKESKERISISQITRLEILKKI